MEISLTATSLFLTNDPEEGNAMRSERLYADCDSEGLSERPSDPPRACISSHVSTVPYEAQQLASVLQ